MSDAKIGVVVVTYNSESTIARCVQSLLNAEHVSRVVVVDNDSRDNTIAIVHEISEDNRLALFLNEENIGFSSACNLGASALTEPLVAFVNPDVYVDATLLGACEKILFDQPDIGLLSCVLKDEAGNEDIACRRRDPHLSTMLSAFGDTSSMFMEVDASESVQNVDAVSGALMLMPASVFALVSGFDEGFLLHAEDLDLCRRVRKAGYRVAIANQLSAVHVRGVSSRVRPYWVEWQKQRSLWRYFQKYDAAHTSAVQRVLIKAGLFARFLLQTMRIFFKVSKSV